MAGKVQTLNKQLVSVSVVCVCVCSILLSETKDNPLPLSPRTQLRVLSCLPQETTNIQYAQQQQETHRETGMRLPSASQPWKWPFLPSFLPLACYVCCSIARSFCFSPVRLSGWHRRYPTTTSCPQRRSAGEWSSPSLLGITANERSLALTQWEGETEDEYKA